MEKKAAKEKIKVNDVVVDKMIEYFKVQDKGDLYRYMKANKIFNSEEPACSQRQELYSAFWQVIALQQIHSS